MKKIMIPIILGIIFIPFMVNAEYNHYYVDNIEINQEFECGDYLNPITPNDLLSSNENTIANVYQRFSIMYSRRFYFEDESSIYNNYSTQCNSSQCNEVQISCYPDGKERKWIIDKVKIQWSSEAAELYLKAVLKEPKISITNQINDNNTYNAKKDEIIKYSIKIKNTGDGKSTDNIIKTNIPDGLFIFEDQISDDGIYDKENNTITWNYELLGPNDEYTFNYYAKVTVEKITEYIGNSYITSSQIQEKVESDDTILTIENKINVPDIIKNPKTVTSISMIIILIVLLVSSFAYILLKREKNYIMK